MFLIIQCSIDLLLICHENDGLKSRHASFPFLMAECVNSYSALRVVLRRAKPFTDLLHVEVLSLDCGAR